MLNNQKQIICDCNWITSSTPVAYNKKSINPRNIPKDFSIGLINTLTNKTDTIIYIKKFIIENERGQIKTGYLNWGKNITNEISKNNNGYKLVVHPYYWINNSEKYYMDNDKFQNQIVPGLCNINSTISSNKIIIEIKKPN
ncbi:MAG TPA: hypothetical protein PKL70_18000 [Saprospiraceae bacterium]|nr:hypothetical protein [Saprospiraceae bacterium]